MALTKNEVEHIATLARLKLSEEEKTEYAKQLSGILDYFGKLNEVDTKDVEETSQVTGLLNVMREDEIEEFSAPQDIVECASEKSDGFIKVPKILDK